MNQKSKDKLAKALGIPEDTQRVLDAGSDHPFTCRCNICLQWWVAMGPEDGEDKEGNYGPFTRDEVLTAQAADKETA